MKSKILAATLVAVLLGVAGLFYANAQAPATPPTDPRIGKLLEQNDKILKNQDKILKNQDDILKALGDLREGILQVRRRTS